MKLKISAIGLYKNKFLKLAFQILPLLLFFAVNQVTAQTVNIQATQPDADEAGSVDGQYVISITGGGLGNSYFINLAVNPTSTATSVDDYDALPALIGMTTNIFGNASQVIDLNVVDDNVVELGENVIYEITSSPGLTPVASSAEVRIASDDIGVITVVPIIPEGNEEGSSIARFRILSDKPNGTGSTAVADYTLSGSATEITDYAVTGNGNFVSNGTTTFKNITITPVDDTVVEGTETVTLTLNSTNNPLFTIGAADNADVSILDNDYTATISATDAVANENGNTGAFTIDLGDVNNTGSAITVNYNITGSADNTDDYNTIGGNAIIADGDQTAVVTITPVDDLLIEGSENVVLTLTNSSGYNLGTLPSRTATVSINDNDSAGINVMQTGGVLATSEPNVADTFTVVLTGAPTSNVVLNITSSDTDEATVSPTSLTFTPGNFNTPQTVTVTGVDDTTIEGQQSYNVTISVDDVNSNNAYDPLNDIVINATNDDDDYLATINANLPNAAEGGASGGFLIALDRINTTGSTIQVNYNLGGTANEGGDYSNLATANIPNNQQDVNIVVNPVDDNDVENTETVIITLAAGTGYTVASAPNNTGTVNIVDNDNFTATVTATEDEAAENTPANSTGEFTIDLGSPNNSGSSITVNYIMSGEADNGADYTNLGSSVTIPNGQQTGIITVVPTDDMIMEGTESATITLTTGVDYVLGPPPTRTATVDIDDNDQATLSIADKAVNENDVNGTLELDVTLDIEVVGGTTVSYTFSDDTATGGGIDYSGNVTPNNILTFTGTAGEVQSIEFTIVDDQFIENTETFNVQLGLPTNGVQLGDGNAVGSINDDDNCVAAPILDTSVSTLFCDVIDRSLNEYTQSVPPAGTTLMWSRSSEALNENAYLLPSEVTNPPNAGSYYGFFLDDNGTPNNFDDDCASGTIEVEIVLNESPILESVTDNERCGPGTVLLSASPSPGASINWYETIDADTPVATGDDFTTPVLNTTRSYYAEAVENGCTSERQEVNATIGIQVATGTPTNGSICNVAINGPTVLDLDDRLAGEGTGTWAVTTDPSNSIILNNENSIDFTGLVSGDYVFTFTTVGSTAPCVEESVDVTISVSDCETDDDNDGLLGGQEATLGTDPSNPDSDGDGIEDGEEVGPDVINPSDEDGDGIIDALDSNTVDTDSDGVNDQQDPANENPCIPDNTSPDCPVDLEVTKSANFLDAVAGDEILFTVIVNNLTDKLVDDAVIGDFIETGFQYVSHTTSIGLYDEVTGQWVIEDLEALGTATMEITVIVQEEGPYTNTAELLSSTPLDENPDNDTATVTIETEVPEGIDLVIVKSVDNKTPLVGDQITFRIEVTNMSEFGDIINNIVVRDSITNGSENLFNYLSHSPSNADYNEVTGIWTIPSLAVGEENTVTLEITGTVHAVGSFDNTATIVSSSPRDNVDSTNNVSAVAVTINEPTPADPGFLFNQFSPNGDGTNDILSINLRNTDTGRNESIIYKINIFDRYGNLVFASDQEQTGKDVWDGTYKGKEVPKGTYFYILNYSLSPDGINYSEPTIDKGWIQLIR